MLAGARSRIISPYGKYSLYEDFSRFANNTVINNTQPLFGPQWRTTGALLPTALSGRGIVPNGAGNGYFYANLLSQPQTIVTEVSFSGGADLTQRAMTIAFASSNNLALSLNDLLHMNFSCVDFNLQVRQAGGSFNTIISEFWQTPMTNDGKIHKLAMSVIGSQVVVSIDDAQFWTINDSRIPSVAGSTVFWEPTTETDGLTAKISKAYTLANSGFTPINYARWNASDSSAANTVSNDGLVITTTGPTGPVPEPQTRCVRPITVNKLYFEVSGLACFSPPTQNIGIGVSSASHLFSSFLGQDTTSVGWWAGSTTSLYVNNVATNLSTSVFELFAGEALGFAFDFTNLKTWIRHFSTAGAATGWNNDVIANQNPATNTGGTAFTITGSPYYITCDMDHNTDSIQLNDGNFAYLAAAPAGFGPASP